nr:MAG TPA: hypothetical protein [Caudoviricetes sp.]
MSWKRIGQSNTGPPLGKAGDCIKHIPKTEKGKENVLETYRPV